MAAPKGEECAAMWGSSDGADRRGRSSDGRGEAGGQGEEEADAFAPGLRAGEEGVGGEERPPLGGKDSLLGQRRGQRVVCGLGVGGWGWEKGKPSPNLVWYHVR